MLFKATKRRLAVLGMVSAGVAATLFIFIIYGGLNLGSSICVASTVTLPKNEDKLEGDTWSFYAPFRNPPDDSSRPFTAQGYLNGQTYKYFYNQELDQGIRACDLTSGKTDFLVTTADHYLLKKPAGKVVGLIDQSEGADALVLDSKSYPYLTSVAQLPRFVDDYKAHRNGQKPELAFTGDSPSSFLLDLLSNTFDDLKQDDFMLHPVNDSSVALKMLENKQVAVAVIWEPDTTTARNAGYTVAKSSGDTPDAILDVVIASNRISQKNPQAVLDLLGAFYRTRDYAAAHPSEYATFITKDSGGQLKPEDTQAMLGGVHLYNLAETNAFLNTKEAPIYQTHMYQALQSIGEIVSLQDPSIKVTPDMIDGSFVAKLASGR